MQVFGGKNGLGFDEKICYNRGRILKIREDGRYRRVTSFKANKNRGRTESGGDYARKGHPALREILRAYT